MIRAVLSNPSHPEYGVATIPFPIPRDQHAHCMELLEALEIGDAVKADCKVEKIDSFYTVLKRVEMLTVNVEELNYLAKRLESFDSGEAAQFLAIKSDAAPFCTRIFLTKGGFFHEKVSQSFGRRFAGFVEPSNRRSFCV